MQRLEEVIPSALDERQKQLYDLIASTRGGTLGGPFSVLIRAPYLAEPANALHNAFRLQGKLDRDLFELLVLLVARNYSAKFAWAVHEQYARRAGLPDEIILAVRERRTPELKSDDQKLIYDLVLQLLETKTIDELSYERARSALGTELLIETVSAVGFYSMVCLVLNSFDVPAPRRG